MTDTRITYNDIQLVNVLTDSIDQTLQLDKTNTDPIHVKVQVQCTAILHISDQQLNTIGRNVRTDGGGDLASGYDAIINFLMQPRRRFVMSVGGNSLFDVSPGHVRPGVSNNNRGNRLPLERVDVNHGPHPEARVLEIISARTIRVQFSVTMHLPYCDTQGRAPGGIISLKFWIAENIDCTDWTTERIYHGRLRVAHLGHSVHEAIRNNVVFPALQPGFVRRRIELNSSPDQLELEFTVRDKEVWAVPPPPITEWTGHHTITSPKPGGPYLESEVSIDLRAPKNVPKRFVFNIAQRILDAKLHLEDAVNEAETWLQYVSWRDDLPNNHVSAIARVKHMGKNLRLWSIEDEQIGLPLRSTEFPSYDKERQVLAQPTATMAGLFVSTLADPCHISKTTQSQGRNQTRYDRGSGVQIVNQNVPLKQTKSSRENKWSSGHQQGGTYVIYKMSSDLKCDSGFVHLPLGKSSQSSSATAVSLQIHQGIAYRTVNIEAERLHDWPEVPELKTFTGPGNIKHTMLDYNFSPSGSQLSADGRKRLYSVLAEITYGLDRCPDPSKNEMPAGLLPYSTAGQDSVFVVPKTAFKKPEELLGSP